MSIIRGIVLVLALIEAGWMAFDGARALVVGDYVTPRTGPHAGELGPWRHAVAAVGLSPRSTAMKLIFLCYGASWLWIAAQYWRAAGWAPTAMVIAAAGALWYLPVGTIFSLAQLAGLLWLRHAA